MIKYLIALIPLISLAQPQWLINDWLLATQLESKVVECNTPVMWNTNAQNFWTAVGRFNWFGEAQRLIPTNSYDVCAATLWLQKIGSPTFTVKVGIFADSGTNTPGSQIGSWSSSLDASTLTTNEQAYVFKLNGASITVGATNWLVIGHDGYNNTVNYVGWSRSSDNDTILNGTSATVWNVESTTRRNRYILWTDQ